MKCLLLETKDKRKFFTHEKNFLQLIEFSRTFNAEISVVKMEQTELLDLKDLAPAICDAHYKKPKIPYEIIETKLESSRKARNEILKVADMVNKHILEQFSQGLDVSLKGLKSKFKRYRLTSATLCNHMRRAKIQLEKQGLKFSKIGAGTYRATRCTT